MPVTQDYLDYVLDQLAGLGPVTSRRMFGAAGLYCDEFFFAIVDDDTLYLKADDSNRRDYERCGMSRFCPDPERPSTTMAYFEVPPDVLENGEALVEWARKSVLVAASSGRRKRKSRLPGRRRV